MAMTTLHVYTLVTWFPAMLQDAGLSATASALLLSWFAGLGLIAAFVVPPLTTRLRNSYPIVVVCVALATTVTLSTNRLRLQNDDRPWLAKPTPMVCEPAGMTIGVV